jgi:PAS domain S-box-containing protein
MDRYFDTNAVGIIETDSDYHITRANSGAIRMLGFTLEELRERSWMDLTHPDDIQKSKDHFEPLLALGIAATTLEVRYLTKGGRTIDVDLNVHGGGAGPDGRPSFYVGFILDVTHTKQTERELIEAIGKLSTLHDQIWGAFNSALDARDPYTAGHENHVADLSDRICAQLGVKLIDTKAVVAAARVHDIGKIAIPMQYLSKPSRLDELEWAVVQSHVQYGYAILQPLALEYPVAETIYQHHERLDGSGYPRKLKGGEISLAAQIIAAADTTDAMLHARAYRPPMNRDFVIEVLSGERGCRIGEDVIDACVAVIREPGGLFAGEAAR